MDTSRSPGFSTVLRLVLGLIWIAGAVYNAAWTLRNTSTFRDDFGAESTFAPYRWFFDSIVGSAPAFWTVLLVLGETTLGLLLLGTDARARLGLVLSAVWSTFLTFMMWPYTLTTIPLLVVSAVLLRYEHSVSFPDVVRTWWVRHGHWLVRSHGRDLVSRN
jgi:uncharacterized membrane protein YphA (DoxX/SURF4 family)